MNWKSPLFKQIKYIPYELFYSFKMNQLKKETFIFQIYSPNDSMYFKSLQYSLFTLLKYSDIIEYRILLIVYGSVSVEQKDLYDVLETIGIEVYYHDKFLSKFDPLLNEEYNLSDKVLFIDVDLWIFSKQSFKEIINLNTVFASANPIVYPKNISQLIEWKTNLTVNDYQKVLKKVLFRNLDLSNIKVIGGCISCIDSKFYKNSKIQEILYRFHYYKQFSDEMVYMIILAMFNINRQTIKVNYVKNINNVSGLVHWTPLMDNNLENIKYFEVVWSKE